MGKILLCVLLGIIGVAAAYLLLLWISGRFVDTEKWYDTDSRYCRFLINSAAACAMVMLRLKVQLTGVEKLPEGRFLLICNHRSNLDPILTWWMMRKYDIAFISKPENFKVPIFGRLIRKCCFLPIDRENPRNAAKTLSAAVKLIKNDTVSVGVYPEGTRSMGTKLLPFHSGVIKIAQKAEVPLVIMSVAGTEQVNHNYPWRSTKIYLDILETIPAGNLKGRHTTDLGDYAYALMAKNLSER